MPPAKGNPWRDRLGARSLTAQLSIGVVALMVVLVTVVCVTTWYSLRYFLDQRLDQQLQNTASNASLGQVLGDPNPYSPFPPPTGVWAVILNRSDGSVFRYPPSESVNRMLLSADDARTLVSRDVSVPMTLTTSDGVQLRVTTRTFIAENPTTRQAVVVVVGLSTSEEHRTLHQLLAIELIIGAAAVVVALFATLYGVRFGLRKLRRVTSTANEVAAELSPTGAGLERRVDVPNDGTEVGQLAESLNTLLSAVETQFAARLRSEARLRQFLADASHELRTPLTSIRGYAELARMQKAAGADSEDNLSRIESEGTRMSRLVEDLLLLARGEQPADVEPVRELVDVHELLEDVASASRAAFPDRRITVDAETGMHIVGDPDQLLRAVRNLVANAAMHTAEGRPILVRGVPDAAEIVIQVVDGGPGLPPEQAAHVFERFWRADTARSRARGGTGLGLAIVAAIVAAHGGSVRFDSSVEQGSTVTIRLPAA